MTLERAIEEMDLQSWAALTKSVAQQAVDSAVRLGEEPPKELVAAAAMPVAELIERRIHGQPLLDDEFAREDSPTTVRETALTHPTNPTGQRILVVDDDPSLAETLTSVLLEEGFATAVIGVGTQALTAVRALKPDLVLLDMRVPGMSSIDVTRELRADSGVPILMLTAKGDTANAVLGLDSGADDYVTKPFDLSELVARVRALLRRTEDAPDEVGAQQSPVLTASEQRVAQLAASGMTDREIADALFISPKAVALNVARVYRKLGIRTRAELGQHMAK